MSGKGRWFCVWQFILACTIATFTFGYAKAKSGPLPICYPPATIDIVRGLGVDQLPYGVDQTCDENGLVAYEVNKYAIIAVPFNRVLSRGLQDSKFIEREWPGDFSVSMRLRMWEKGADIINILDAYGGHRFGISAGTEGVFLKFNGMVPAVRISSVNVADGKFHRILLSFRGNFAFSRVSGRDISTCGDENTRVLRIGAGDRRIPIKRGFVVLGREGYTGIETPQVTIQQLVFMPDPFTAYSCPYEIDCFNGSGDLSEEVMKQYH